MAWLQNVIEIAENDEEEIQEEIVIQRVRNYTDRYNPFDFPDVYFKKIFRLNKGITRQLIDVLETVMPGPSRSSAITVQDKVLTSLCFLASGSYQMTVGRNMHSCISQPSVSRALSEVVAAINTHLFDEWVKFDLRQPFLISLRQGFFQKFNFPGTIGAIDCTHVAIFPPPVDHPIYPERDYYNHKGFHSLNVQLVCDSKMRILNMSARYPGATHDSHIFRNSALRNALRNKEAQNPHQKMWLLGDSGYGLESFLMTPVPGYFDPLSPQGRYNARHRSTRNVVERCIGVLKGRWRCLRKDRALHYQPPKASHIVNTCAVLHNMCIENNVEFDEDLYLDDDNDDDLGIEQDVARGHQTRNMIINRYFT